MHHTQIKVLFVAKIQGRRSTFSLNALYFLSIYSMTFRFILFTGEPLEVRQEDKKLVFLKFSNQLSNKTSLSAPSTVKKATGFQ